MSIGIEGLSIRLIRKVTTKMQNKMPKHIVNLLILLVSVVVLALIARNFLTDPSYYRFGNYRADAVTEIASRTPLIKGSAYCQDCHTERQDDWPTGSHKTVQCEVCHGTVEDHPDDGKTLVPTDTIKLCTNCHEALAARPDRQPQIDSLEHNEDAEQCQACHDPHSPGDSGPVAVTDSAGQAVASAGVGGAPAVVKKCAKCHGKQGEGKKKSPALAGLEIDEFIKRINVYKTDPAKSKKMSKYAQPLSDEEIAELATYYKSLPAKTPE